MYEQYKCTLVIISTFLTLLMYCLSTGGWWYCVEH